MIEILRTDNGDIKAVCEFYIVDEKGNFDRTGEFAWVNELEVSKSYRNNGCIKYFITEIIRKYPQLKFGYFHRRKKYPNRGIRIYHKEQWLKLIN